MNERTRLRQQDFWTALTLIAVSGFFLFKTSEIPFFQANAAGVESGRWYNSAALVPYGIFAAILLLGVMLLVTAIRQGGTPDAGQFRSVVAWMRSDSVQRMAAGALVMLAYIFALVPRVDFILSSALVLLALIYGFHETRLRATRIALLVVLVPSVYALAAHLPRSEWNAHHDDDWLTLAAFVALTLVMYVEIRRAGRRPDAYLKIAPVIAVAVPILLIIAMAFGFRQNVPNRTGLVFQKIEYHYYVTIKPWLAGKDGR
ncbi:hypothetical protein [Oricola thermophila]|uniref:Tripartite tricarboxylate transporter TctB family protein n=1 Tax=Oricola thermophila TaxID=2742145 RepID=A0A6N1VHC8_9HYPH|nr:hypothetical protein [Oricola thermophila]QKV19105.1 hypothetical protein HTY61_11895 [Oricola thermophila]